MTYAETKALFGTEIEFQYYNTSGGYSTATFHVEESYGERIGSGAPVLYQDSPYIWYQAHVPNWSAGSQQTQTVVVDLHPNYNVVDSDYLFTAIGLSTYLGGGVSSIWNPPSWEYTAGANRDTVMFYGSANNNDYVSTGWFQVGGISLNTFTVVPVAFDINDSNYEQYASPYESWECKFYGNQLQYYSYQNNEYCALCIMCPFVQDGSSTASGALTTASTSDTSVSSGVTDINVNVTVNVNNSEVISAINAQNAANSEYQDAMLNNTNLGEVTTIASAPESDIQAMLTDNDDIWDTAEGMIETSGFWLALVGYVYSLVPAIKLAAPVFVLFSILAYVWWRK